MSFSFFEGRLASAIVERRTTEYRSQLSLGISAGIFHLQLHNPWIRALIFRKEVSATVFYCPGSCARIRLFTDHSIGRKDTIMNDNMLQNASKLIEGNLTCNGGAPVIWLHGNARREMEKLRLRHADISLRAHSVRTLAEYGCVKSAGAALAYLLFMERAQSVLVSYDEIARMSLRDELDLALEDATGGNLVVFVDQLATALATSPDAAASFLGFGEKLAEWYGDRVRVVLTDDLGYAKTAEVCGAKAISDSILDIPMELEPMEAVRRETRAETIRWMVDLLQECGGLPFIMSGHVANAAYR